MPLGIQAKWASAVGALWSAGIVCACGRQLGVRPVGSDSWSGSVWEEAATLSAAAVLSLLVTRHPRCRSFIVSLCKSSWTDALLFLPSATAFFMPVACGGVEYPWAFWTTLVPMVVGAVTVVTVVTLFARRGRFAFGAGGRHHISSLFAAVRAPASAVLQIVALWAALCAVPLRFCIPAATVVDSWTTMLALLTLAAAAAAAVTAVLRWIARAVLRFSARSIRVSLLLGMVAVAFLQCRDGDGELGASDTPSTPALLARTAAAAGRRAWLAAAQSPSFTAVVGIRQANAGVQLPSSCAGLAPACGSVSQASCTLLLSWARVAVSILSATALLSSVSIKVVDAAGSEKTGMEKS
ncbi:hypothetical protein E8E11_000513 [Didymella keratinophila]|nr:hypothetical protein E8E11_000513 [Didymella keratinophila]